MQNIKLLLFFVQKSGFTGLICDCLWQEMMFVCSLAVLFVSCFPLLRWVYGDGGPCEWATGWSAGRVWAKKESETNHGLYWWCRGQGLPPSSWRANHAVWGGASRETREVGGQIVMTIGKLWSIFWARIAHLDVKTRHYTIWPTNKININIEMYNWWFSLLEKLLKVICIVM